LQELPNVLNFQLLRFQYDLQTGSKKKLSKNIQFPLRVNMRKYMQPTYASSLYERTRFTSHSFIHSLIHSLRRSLWR